MSLVRQTPILLDGPQGTIEVFVDLPANDTAPNGIVLIGHPHPLFGGTPDNKVVTTLSRVLRARGAVALRPSFRGVGASAGEHDHGNGETDDLLAVLDWARQRWGDLPVTLAGFSFGAYVITRVAQRLAAAQRPARWMVLVGTAAGMINGARQYDTAAVTADTLVIHGAEDTTVPLANVLAWAEPLEIPVIVVPGADHFFHRKLHILYDIVDRRRPA
ncbi:MAG: alpha/beta fold hydrolase [Rugosibacter sp.]